MKFTATVSVIYCLGIFVLTLFTGSLSATEQSAGHIERGKYLVKIAGCNDCHTPGYLMSGGKVPSEVWLTGDTFGWRGDWGTTYATNLRMRMQDFSEAEWIAYARTLKTRPPMPWFTLNEMQEEDLKAIYHFVRHLGPGGKPSTAFVPPGKEPNPPFAQFPPAPPPMN